MKVHFISPYRTDRNIGLAINQAIDNINTNNEDWIILQDMDVLWLRSDSKSQLIEILESTQYDLLGTTTNRLANDYQLCCGMFEEDSILKHVQVAYQQHETHYGEVIPYSHVLAAFCLCFRVSTWKQLGGFEEGTITFDTTFSLKAMEAGFKLGLCIGIYQLHLYRYGSTNPKYDVKHLLA